MLRVTAFVLVLFVFGALVLTACVQPTPTPESTSAATAGPGLTEPTAEPNSTGYPNPITLPTPTLDLTAYPGGRQAAPHTFGAVSAAYR